MKSGVGFLSFRLCRLIPVLLVILLSLLVLSCDLWNKDMLGYLEHWSETVQVGKVEVTGATIQKNDSGADTISTAATPTIAGYVVNPKAYELVAEIGDSSSADKSVRVSSLAVQSKVHVVAHEPTMLKIQLDSADSSLEHTEFRVDFEAIRQDTMQSSGQVMGVTLRYNTPPAAPTPVVRNEAGEYMQPPAGQVWEAYRDGTLYWAYDDSIEDETDPNCAKWFAVNGTRHPVADLKIKDARMAGDNRSIFGLNVGYGSTSVAAVDSEGVSSPLLSSGQAVPPATYVIKYDGNEATGGAAPASQSKTQYTPVTLAANVGNLTRIGYRFSGWNTAKDGRGTTYPAGATYSADAGATLYAKWEAVDAVVLTPESGAVNHGARVTLTPPKPDATIYYQIPGAGETAGAPGQPVIVTLYNETNLPQNATGADAGIPENGSTTITAYAKYADGTQSEVTSGSYSLNRYTVVYVQSANENGSVPAAQTFASGSSVTVQGTGGLTKTGYTFAGWQGDDGQPYSQGTVYDKDKDLTLTAQWTASTYTVILDDIDGTGGSGNVTVTYDQPLPSVKVPTKTGYTFGGYFDGRDGTGTKYYDASGNGVNPWKETRVSTLYAQWIANQYSVVFYPNGGGGNMFTRTFTYDTAANLPSNQFSKTDFTFAGWATQSGSIASYPDGSSILNLTAVNGGQVELYATWGKSATDLTAVQDLINSASSSADPVTIVLTGDLVFTNSTTNSYALTIPAGANVTLQGDGDKRIIQGDSAGWIEVSEGTLTLGPNLVIDGSGTGVYSHWGAISVDCKGTLIMEEGAEIINMISGGASYGAVYIGRGNSSYGGTFIMNGGRIENNSGGGAAVLVSQDSTFIMNGGQIIGNKSGSNQEGGGVHVDAGSGSIPGGVFELNGGTISGNFVGGGTAPRDVTVETGATFNHNGGTIGQPVEYINP